LAKQLIQSCRILAEAFGALRCAITGGRDSRVVASLLIHGGISGRYHTCGDPESKDAHIASLIATKFNLLHEILPLTNQDILERWDIICTRLIRQGDGMISLWQLSDVLNQPQQVDQLMISLSGMGGEIARSSFYNPLEALQKHRPEDMERMMIDALVLDYGGLVLPEARKLSITQVQKTIQESFDQGLSGLDVMDAFFTLQDVGRWAGSNRRRSNPVVDIFAPLCIRPFVKGAFMIPPAYRYSHWLHRQLIDFLVPELSKLPFDKDRWPSQLPPVNVLEWIWKRSLNKVRRFRQRFKPRRREAEFQPIEFDQVAWLEKKRDWMREICLDQRDSMLWNFVNRPLYERIMSASTDPAERWTYRLGIYGIVTLFYYATMEKSPG